MPYREHPLLPKRSLLVAAQPGMVGRSDAPLRTLKRSHLVSGGIEAQLRAGRGGRLAGHLRLYSSLSRDGARLARLGFRDDAATAAEEAADLEASDPALTLIELLGRITQPIHVIDGWQAFLHALATPAFADALAALADLTEERREDLALPQLHRQVIGRLVQLDHARVVIITDEQQPLHLHRQAVAAIDADWVGSAVVLQIEEHEQLTIIEVEPAMLVGQPEPLPIWPAAQPLWPPVPFTPQPDIYPQPICPQPFYPPTITPIPIGPFFDQWNYPTTADSWVPGQDPSTELWTPTTTTADPLPLGNEGAITALVADQGYTINNAGPLAVPGQATVVEHSLAEETWAHFRLIQNGPTMIIPCDDRQGQPLGQAYYQPNQLPQWSLPGFDHNEWLYHEAPARTALAEGSNCLVVVEGFRDAWAVWQAGFRAVVALAGCHLPDQSANRLVRLAWQHAIPLLMWPDPDRLTDWQPIMAAASQRSPHEIVVRWVEATADAATLLYQGQEPELGAALTQTLTD
jgi:hypothetical protein